MTAKEMEKKALEIKELERMRDELDAEIVSLQDEIKGVLLANGLDSAVAGAFKISWKEVASSRLDTAALKKELPDVCARFMKSSVTRRFLIN